MPILFLLKNGSKSFLDKNKKRNQFELKIDGNRFLTEKINKTPFLANQQNLILVKISGFGQYLKTSEWLKTVSGCGGL